MDTTAGDASVLFCLASQLGSTLIEKALAFALNAANFFHVKEEPSSDRDSTHKNGVVSLVKIIEVYPIYLEYFLPCRFEMTV